jgi:hypothetical protein
MRVSPLRNSEITGGAVFDEDTSGPNFIVQACFHALRAFIGNA